MTEFIILAALLVAAAILIMAVPLLRRAPDAGSSAGASQRREANLAILRDQLAELENERREGTLSDADFEQAKGELQRRLLEETQAEETQAEAAQSSAANANAAGRKSALAVLLALPIAVAAGYAVLGEPRALNPQATQPASKVSEQQMLALVGQLAERLKARPDDLEGWVTLARSYKTLRRYTEAASAYARGGRMVEESAPLLADYAETLGQIAQGSLLGRPQELLQKALKLDPDEPQALLLAGAAASEEQRFADAADYWERLLKQMDPNAEETRALADAASKARELARHGASAAAAAGVQDGKKGKAAASSAVAGEVKLAPALAGRVKPDDVIFVFARAEDGERRPLAALRGNAASLPLRFRLDDAAALPGGRKLSEVPTVVVEARIARAGMAQSSSGDLYGRLTGVRPGSSDLQLVIDQIEP